MPLQHGNDNLSEWLQTFPNSAVAQAEARDFAPFRGLPNQTNGRRLSSVLKHEEDHFVPVSVNGEECTFLNACICMVKKDVCEVRPPPESTRCVFL